jgi:DNA-directed RNA polymerase subunit M/transcription elongation factor TFIIS
MEFCPKREMRLISTKSKNKKGEYVLTCPKYSYQKISNEKN